MGTEILPRDFIKIIIRTRRKGRTSIFKNSQLVWAITAPADNVITALTPNMIKSLAAWDLYRSF